MLRASPAPSATPPAPAARPVRRLRTDLAQAPARLTGATLADPATVRPAYGDPRAVARYTGLSETTVRRACWRGELEASRVGSRLVIQFAAVDRWLAAARIGRSA